MNRRFTFLTLSATLLVSGPAFAQSAGPLPAPSNRAAVTSQAPTDSNKTKDTSIRIVCASSIKPGKEPLYIVDGQPIDNEKFKILNPDNIDKVKVLQGVRASALYGSRAANGAVIITTKK